VLWRTTAHKLYAYLVIFNVPRSWSVLVLDDSEDRISWFRQRLRNVKFAKRSEAAINLFSEQSFKVAFLDHDLHWMDAGFPNLQHATGKKSPVTLRATASAALW
jgi:CheY-like chemotaxis protein